MTVYYVIPFSDRDDYDKVIEIFEPFDSPFGRIEIVDCAIKAPSVRPRFIIKFKLECKISDAPYCVRMLNGYLFNVLGEFY